MRRTVINAFCLRQIMKQLIPILSFSLFALACNNSSTPISSNLDSPKDKNRPPAVPPTYNAKILWLDNVVAELSMDYKLCYKKGIMCDSAIAIDYIGFEGELFYFPINSKGQWIDTIKKRQTKRSDSYLCSSTGSGSFINASITSSSISSNSSCSDVFDLNVYMQNLIPA